MKERVGLISAFFSILSSSKKRADWNETRTSVPSATATLAPDHPPQGVDLLI
jgi:hypothetical protein